MNDNVKDFGLAKARNGNSSKDVTPAQLLRLIIEDIEAGRINPTGMVVAFTNKHTSGAITIGGYRSQINKMEEVALYSIGLNNSINSGD